MDNSGSLAVDEAATRRMQNFPYSGGLYGGLPPTHNEAGAQTHTIHGTALIGGLPMPYPNLAPDVDLTPVAPSTVAMNPAPNPAVFNPEVVNEPKKKKYAKEAWPGKKPTPSLLIWRANLSLFREAGARSQAGKGELYKCSHNSQPGVIAGFWGVLWLPCTTNLQKSSKGV